MIEAQDHPVLPPRPLQGIGNLFRSVEQAALADIDMAEGDPASRFKDRVAGKKLDAAILGKGFPLREKNCDQQNPAKGLSL